MKQQRSRNKPAPARHGRFSHWLLQHARAFFSSLGQLYRKPAGGLVSISVIGISLALPAGFYALLENAQRVTSHLDVASHISLFLSPDIEEERVIALADRLRARSDIIEVDVINPEEALAEYKQNSGFADALDALGRNPLPFVLVVRPQSVPATFPGDSTLLSELNSLPEVDLGQLDWQWAQRLHQIIEVFQRGVLIVAALFAGAVLLVVGNTIRMSVHNRRQEIEVHKLFGATDAFIARPFLYSGMLHGIAGSMLAWLMLEVSMALLQGPVARLADLYGSRFFLATLSAGEVLGLVLIGAGLGLTGSWLSVKRHLRSIDPI
ncbi:MAG: permease-like cell division protein FtsX [Gammaproteobacteria bacterium]|nr:permease-like cell division protein FtsX [Gammaproteobacteria bacterium]